MIQDQGTGLILLGFITHKGAPAGSSRVFLNRMSSAAPANPDSLPNHGGQGCFPEYRSGPPGTSKGGNEESNLSTRKKILPHYLKKSLDIIQVFLMSLIRTILNDCLNTESKLTPCSFHEFPTYYPRPMAVYLQRWGYVSVQIEFSLPTLCIILLLAFFI